MFAIAVTLLICLFPLTSAYTLQGSWVLHTLQDQNTSFQTNFSYYIFRNQSIMGKMQITGCQLLSYQFNLQDDNIYIDTSSQRLEPLKNCTKEQSLIMDGLQEALTIVLKFSINDDVLVFMEPSQDTVATFRRLKNATYESWQKDLGGSWLANMVGDQQISYIMVANESALSLCSGALFSFKITALYRIKVTLLSQGGCKDQNVIKNVVKATFYRKFDSKLQFYDNGINLLLEAIYNPNGNKLMPQPASTPASNDNSPGSSSGFPQGKYFLLLLYNRSLGRIQISITSSTITLQICSQLIFNYSLAENSGLKVQSTSTPTTNCSKGNEVLIFNTLIQGIKYNTDSDGVITLIDSNGKSIISLSQ